jgi:hypothetical protein
MSVMDRLRGKSETFSGWEVLWSGLQDAWRPFDARIGAVEGRYREWFEREQQRPTAVVTGGAPDQVNEQILDARRQRTEAGRAFGQAAIPAIRAELERRVDELSRLYARAADVMDDLRAFELELHRFAHAAGIAAPESVTDDGLTGSRFRQWQDRVQARLHPLPPQPIMRAADNPLALD